jgi:cyclopropane-fatty-acyl-phospholipid synthase
VLHCACWPPHYGATLRRWLQNLRANEARAIELVGRATYRAYLLYFAGSAAAFDTGRVSVHQTLLAKRGRSAPSLPVEAELGF